MDQKPVNGHKMHHEHPFKGISQTPRVVVYAIGTLTLSVALLVFTERYLAFLSAAFSIKMLVVLPFAFVSANLHFFIVRRLSRKLFEPHPWIYAFIPLFMLPWGLWIYFKAEYGFDQFLFGLGAIALGGFAGTEWAKRKAAIFRKDFLDKWRAEIARQEAAKAAEKQ